MILMTLLAASAAEIELTAEAGSLANRDPHYDLFANGNAMPSVGLSVAGRPGGLRHFPVAAVASWQHSSRGANVFGPEVQGFTAAFTADTFALGARVDADLGGVFSPYVTVQGAVMRGLARFDDDTSENDNPGQISVAGLAPGLLTVGGAEFSSPEFDDVPLEFVFKLEMGYGWVAPMDLDTLGTMQPGGFLIRSGIGARFGRKRTL